jgi:hypothetical protein
MNKKNEKQMEKRHTWTRRRVVAVSYDLLDSSLTQMQTIPIFFLLEFLLCFVWIRSIDTHTKNEDGWEIDLIKNQNCLDCAFEMGPLVGNCRRQRNVPYRFFHSFSLHHHYHFQSSTRIEILVHNNNNNNNKK